MGMRWGRRLSVGTRFVGIRVSVGLAVLLVAGGQPALAQGQIEPARSNRALLYGTVVGADGVPLGGAVVSVPAVPRSVTTNAEGRYRLTGLPPGPIAVQFRAIGHQPTATTLRLASGEERQLDAALPTATVSMNELVVTGTATTGDQLSAQSVSAVGDAELRGGNTASLGKLLETVPGLSNISAGPSAGNVVIRGLSQNRIRLMRDGVAQENFQATARWVPPSNLASIERIEVIRGPASILYGSNAIGGAVNLLPRSLPVTASGQTRLEGLIATQYHANNDERYAHTELGVGLGAALGIRAGLSRRLADNFATADAQPYSATGRRGDPKFVGPVPFTNYEQSEYYAQVGTSGDWGQAQLFYDAYKGDNNFSNASGRPTGVSTRNHDLRLKGSILLGSTVLRPTLVYQQVGIRRAATAALAYEQAEATEGWDQDLLLRSYTGRVEAVHPALHHLHGTVGIEVNRQDNETRLSRIQPSAQLTNLAAFVFEEWRRDNLSISAGGRIDYREQAAAGNSLTERLPPSDRAAALARRFTVLTGSVGSGYRLAEPLTVTINFSTGFRAPSLIDLYTDENRPVLGGWQEGNPALTAEESRGLEGSVRYESRRLAARATVYRNWINNFIFIQRSDRTRTVSGQTVPVFTTSQADARLTGLEVSADAEPVGGVFVEGSYARIRTRNEQTGEELPLMPADQVRGSLRLLRHRLAFAREPYVQLGVRHSRAKRIAGPTEPFAEFDTNPQGFGISSTPAYTLLSLGLGARLPVGPSSIELYLEVENLLDEAYRDFLDTQKGYALGQGRNVSLRLAAPLVLNR
jgi:iron complex outermembrane receptor protein/hemoglobin/transferrin/lactoferrin receptor protein